MNMSGLPPETKEITVAEMRLIVSAVIGFQTTDIVQAICNVSSLRQLIKQQLIDDLSEINSTNDEFSYTEGSTHEAEMVFEEHDEMLVVKPESSKDEAQCVVYVSEASDAPTTSQNENNQSNDAGFQIDEASARSVQDNVSSESNAIKSDLDGRLVESGNASGDKKLKRKNLPPFQSASANKRSRPHLLTTSRHSVGNPLVPVDIQVPSTFNNFDEANRPIVREIRYRNPYNYVAFYKKVLERHRLLELSVATVLRHHVSPPMDKGSLRHTSPIGWLAVVSHLEFANVVTQNPGASLKKLSAICKALISNSNLLSGEVERLKSLGLLV